MKYLKIKIFVIALCLLAFQSQSKAQMTEGQAAIVGGIIGYVIGKNNKPQPVYANQPQIVVPQQPYYGVPQQPIVVYPSQLPMYDPELHGFCAGYMDVQYAHCMGSMKRKKLDDAYQRGFTGR